MPSFNRKDGSKGFHINPQAARTHESAEPVKKAAAASPAKVLGGPHEQGAAEHARLANYDGHLHEGHALAHHVEMHHGGHAEGEPAMHEGHSHHTITHPHDGGGGGGESQPEIHNHENPEEAHQHIAGAMHEGCVDCDSGTAEPGIGESAEDALAGHGDEQFS